MDAFHAVLRKLSQEKRKSKYSPRRIVHEQVHRSDCWEMKMPEVVVHLILTFHNCKLLWIARFPKLPWFSSRRKPNSNENQNENQDAVYFLKKNAVHGLYDSVSLER